MHEENNTANQTDRPELIKGRSSFPVSTRHDINTSARAPPHITLIVYLPTQRAKCLTQNLNLILVLQPLQTSQAQRQPLAATPYTHEPSNRTVVTLLLDAQIRQRILAYPESATDIPKTKRPQSELTENTPGIQIR